MESFSSSTRQRVYEQARQARDPRFDGRFFVGVKTTGIYCRPVCPVKMPQSRNVVFFATAAAAGEAGFRPCLRCRPESSPGTPAWSGTSTTVSRGLRLIGEGALDQEGVETLSSRLGVTSRHLSRLFMQHLGASPKSIAQTRRLQAAKKMLNETALPMTEIALAAGYGSVRRFNDHFQQVYKRSPSGLRSKTPVQPGSAFTMRMPFRPPYDFGFVLNFLTKRATPGVEFIENNQYRRAIQIENQTGDIVVSYQAEAGELLCEVQLPSSKHLMTVISRVRRLFDLDADPLEIHGCLAGDPELAKLIEGNPGLRLPGAWEPFEVLVRAITGQQISVKGATVAMGKIAQKWSEKVDGQLLFPTPESLAILKPEELPMPATRGQAIIDVSRSVCEGSINLATPDPDELREGLVRIKGIGPWTAEYVAMRAVNDPDAFLDSDLVLRKVAASHLGLDSQRALLERAESWRPWRAYAAMYLWSIAT